MVQIIVSHSGWSNLLELDGKPSAAAIRKAQAKRLGIPAFVDAFEWSRVDHPTRIYRSKRLR